MNDNHALLNSNTLGRLLAPLSPFRTKYTQVGDLVNIQFHNFNSLSFSGNKTTPDSSTKLYPCNQIIYAIYAYRQHIILYYICRLIPLKRKRNPSV